MQNAIDLLYSLYQRGMKVSAEDGLIRIQTATGDLLHEEVSGLSSLKTQMLELLAQTELNLDAPIEPRTHNSLIPLTAIQRRIIRFSKQEKVLSVRLCTIALRVLGELDIQILREVLEVVVQRHESLRTRFVAVDGIWRQQVDAAYGHELEMVDLSDVSAPDRDEDVRQRISALTAEQIDLSIGPLLAMKVFKLAALEHVLILAMDHITTDEMSLRILKREIWTLYRQATQRLPYSLPKLRVQFGDYAVWQHRTCGAWFRNHAPYWMHRMAGAPPIEIPYQADVSAAANLPVTELTISFGDGLSEALRTLARREQTQLSIVVLAIYVIVMARWCKQRDVSLSLTYSGRSRPELKNITGFLACYLFLRVEIVEQDCFLDVLARIKQELYLAYTHYDFDRVPDFVPDFDTMHTLHFNWTQETSSEIRNDFETLKIERFAITSKVSPYFLPFFRDTDAGVIIYVFYRPALFAANSVEQLGHNLRSFAEDCSRDPLAHVWR